MRKLVSFIFLTVLLSLTNVYSQQKYKLTIYTDIKEAEFIPYINNEKMLMSPVTKFETYVEDTTIVVFINFTDTNVYDIEFTTKFSKLFPEKKFKIVEKSNKKISNFGKKEHIINTTDKVIIDKYTIKNETLKQKIKSKKKK